MVDKLGGHTINQGGQTWWTDNQSRWTNLVDTQSIMVDKLGGQTWWTNLLDIQASVVKSVHVWHGGGSISTTASPATVGWSQPVRRRTPPPSSSRRWIPSAHGVLLQQPQRGWARTFSVTTETLIPCVWRSAHAPRRHDPKSGGWIKNEDLVSVQHAAAGIDG